MNPWSIYFIYGGAAGMVVAVAVVLWLYKSSRNMMLRTLMWLLYVLASMIVMFGAAAFYLINQSTSNLFTAILIANTSMIIWLLLLGSNWGRGRGINPKLSGALIIVMVLMAELLMGITYTLYIEGPKDLLLKSLDSPWFVIPMTLEAAISYVLTERGGRDLFALIAPPWILNMLFNPVMLPGAWFRYSLLASSIIMVMIIILMLDYMHRHKVLQANDMHVMLGASAVMAVMMIIQLAASLGALPWAMYGAALLVDMGWYLAVYVNHKPQPRSIAWLTKPIHVAVFLSLIFIAEAAMGGVISMEMGWLNPEGLSESLSQGLVGIIQFISALTLGPGFMIMMGIEMGWLVAARALEVHNAENRARLILMMVSYALYGVYASSFLPPSLARYPYLEWSMGLGTAGPLSPYLLMAVLGTYAINGAASFLFGARQVCSLTCTAAYMWQGTFYDDLKMIKPTRITPRKGVIRRIHDALMMIMMPSLIVLALLSYLNQIGYVKLALGLDPLVLLYLVSFGIAWYLFFALSPILGTYNCVTYGWCHWGAFNRLMGRIGFFKLVAKDPSICIKCRTRDCARACPTGNSTMPGSFITSGHYKSLTCIGVGDCVEACPYDNIEIHDVRHSLRLNAFRELLASINGRSR